MDGNAMLAAYTAIVARRMGKVTTTSTSELDEYGRRWFTPQQFLGVFPADHEPPRTKRKCFFIQNTKPASHRGEHWTAIGREPGRPDLFFDSYARKPSAHFMPHLQGATTTHSDVDQSLDSTICGQMSLGWAHCFIERGYEVAQAIG
eukprot:COSAG02_NODE_2303_length_9183_cov_6.229369_2_plen_147_part_00